MNAATPALGMTPTQAITTLQEDLGLSMKDLQAILDTDARNISRWIAEQSYPQREARRRLAGLLQLNRRLHEAFTVTAGAQDWLRDPSRYLAGLTPLDALRAGRLIAWRQPWRRWNPGCTCRASAADWLGLARRRPGFASMMPFPCRHLGQSPLRSSHRDDVEGDTLVHLKVHDPVNHQIEHLSRVIEVNDGRQVDSLRLVDASGDFEGRRWVTRGNDALQIRNGGLHLHIEARLTGAFMG